MAQGDRVITIGAKVDASLKAAVSAVEREVNKLNSALGKGANAQSPGMDKLMQGQLKAFSEMKKIGVDTFRALATEAERAAGKEQAAFERAHKVVAKMTQEYNSLAAAQKNLGGGRDSGTDKSLEAAARKLQWALKAQDARSTSVSSLNATAERARIGAGGGPPNTPNGNNSGNGNNENNKGMSASDMVNVGAAVARAVGSALGSGGGLIQQWKNQDIQNMGSAAQSTVGRFLRGSMSGDLRDMYTLNALKSMRGGGTVGQGLDSTAGGQGAPLAMSLGKGLAGIAETLTGAAAIGVSGGAASVLGAGAMANGIVNTAGAIGGVTNGGTSVQELQSMGSNIDAYQAANPMQMAAFDLIGQEKSMRATQSRRLMGRHLAAYGTGGGYGYTRGESGSIAESLQRMGGMDGMFGTTVAPHFSKNATFSLQPLTGSNVKMGTASDFGGGRTRGLLESAMQLAGHGIDMGTGQQALSSIFQAGGGAKGIGVERSMQALEKAVARGTAQGFTDPRTQEELVSALGQASQGSMLTGTDGLQRLASFLTGGATNGTLADMQARRGALAASDSLFKGNSFFQQQSIASAKGLVGSGPLSSLQLATLGGATPTELLKGGTVMEKDLGITQSMRSKQLHDQYWRILGAHAAEDPQLKQSMMASGGDFSKIPVAQMRRTLFQYGGFHSDTGANAMANMLHGLGNGDVTTAGQAKRLKQFGDQAAFAAISTEERTKQLLEKLVGDIGKLLPKLDPEEQLKAQMEAEKRGDYDISKYKRFLVEIIKPLDALKPTPKDSIRKQ